MTKKEKTLDELIAEISKQTVRIHNIQTDEIVDREMSDEEFEVYRAEKETQLRNQFAEKLASAQAEAEAEAKAEAKAAAQAKLEALGLTVEDLTALGL
jgi:hypothetical protein